MRMNNSKENTQIYMHKHTYEHKKIYKYSYTYSHKHIMCYSSQIVLLGIMFESV